MKIEGWKYYKHMMLPLCAPHEDPDTSKIKNKKNFIGELYEM